MTFELITELLILLSYVASILYVTLHSFLFNKESPISARVVWILVTVILGIFGAFGYYFYGSGEYYKLNKVK